MKKRMFVKLCTFLLSGIVVASSTISVSAAPKQMPDGGIFDAEYYAAANPDVVAVLGTDETLLYQHYLICGKAEGRLPYAPSGTGNSGSNANAMTPAQRAALAPPFNAPANRENALRLTQLYDPDGYYILTNAGDYAMDFWLRTGDNLSDALDTCVHETFHSYTFDQGSFGFGGYTEAIYIGDGQTIQVPKTAVFRTQEWSGSLPAELRTFRYNTYVSPGASASANQDGPYGLLNEFAAYGWGMNNQIALFDYYAAQPFSRNVWLNYVSNCENDYTAFCEFRFYILGYLNYAYTTHPEIWRQITENRDFVNAYCVTERRFEKNIAGYRASQQTIAALGRESGYQVMFSGGMFYIGGYATGVANSGRAQLLAQIMSPAYQAQEQYLFSKCSLPVMPIQEITP